jgi:hypothetical protein
VQRDPISGVYEIFLFIQDSGPRLTTPSGEFDLDTFEEHEWLKAVEIAWTPSVSRYKTDRIQFTHWNKDEREEAGVPEGSG